MDKKGKITLSVLIALIILVGFFSLYPVFALEENTKEYDSVNKIVTIKDPSGEVISDITLNTPLNYYVGAGYGKVAEFEINLFDDTYSDAFEKMEFYNKRNMEGINREFDYKYKTTELVDVNDYKESCSISGNGTKVCEQVISGTHQEEREIWKDLDTNVLTKGKVTIGIFTYVEVGDYVEWIPTLFGKEINEWATWTARLNVGLINYWAFDQSTGTNVLDNITTGQNRTLSATQPVWATGKIGNGLDFQDVDGKYIDFTGVTSATFSNTICFWIKNKGIATADNFLLDIQTGRISLVLNTSQNVVLSGAVSGGVVYDALPNAWTHVCLVLDSFAGNVRMYYDGTQVGTNQTYLNKSIGGAVVIGNRYTMNPGYYMNMTIDEFGIWNRTLTGDEITQLYNDGDGITYTDVLDNYTITFNFTDVKTGAQIELSAPGKVYLDIVCDNDLEVVDGVDNPYIATDGFLAGAHSCNASITGYFQETIDFDADANKTIQVPMSPAKGLTQEEHDWLEAVYKCLIEGTGCA